MTESAFPKPVAGAATLAGGLIVAFGLLASSKTFLLDIKVAQFVCSMVIVSALAASFSRGWVTILHDILQPVCVVAMLVGMTQMLVQLADPSQIAPAYAIAMLGPVYGLLLAGVTAPWKEPSTELPLGGRLAIGGLIVFWAVVVTAILARDGSVTFLSSRALCLIGGGVVFFAGADWLRGQQEPGRWRDRLLGLGAVGLMGGILGARASINDPKAIGGAMAFSLLTMLYSLMLLVSARIVFPSSVLPEGKSSMGVGLMSLTVPMWLFSFFTFVVLVLSMMES
jgi:hypothetical protein